jgi:RimJ/RimL family protein N-acetyltransferase
MNDVPLFQGELVCLAPPEPDRDAEVESRWTHDAEYLRLLAPDPARPLSPGHIKKQYEIVEKGDDKAFGQYHFVIRAQADDRLLGFVRLEYIEWTHGAGFVRLGISDPHERGRGYGSEALGLILRYAFDELNLHRLTAVASDYNPGAVRFFERAGFTVEVRLRQAQRRDGRRWDALILGLLRPEWEARRKGGDEP